MSRAFSGEVPGALGAPYIEMGGKAAPARLARLWVFLRAKHAGAVRRRKCGKSGI
jgi:hypothetical protein